MQTSDGTTNMGRKVKSCLERRGISAAGMSKGAQQTLEKSVSQYTKARHRTLIALRCAIDKRPYDSISDELYIEEVDLLRPGTKLPSPSTVSRDVQALYSEGGKRVKEYFAVRCFCAP